MNHVIAAFFLQASCFGPPGYMCAPHPLPVEVDATYADIHDCDRAAIYTQKLYKREHRDPHVVWWCRTNRTNFDAARNMPCPPDSRAFGCGQPDLAPSPGRDDE